MFSNSKIFGSSNVLVGNLVLEVAECTIVKIIESIAPLNSLNSN
nr:MAG TPA: hypothetical protein [Myoviridae sp. ctTS62]